MSVADDLRAHVAECWADDVLPALERYIRIPNVSPAYEPAWAELGHMDAAVDLVVDWCRSRPIDGLTVEVQQLPGLTPLVICEVPGRGDHRADDVVLLYGHLDKQPEMTGWRDGLGPWTPVVEDGRLYGRGGGDDGYAAFAALTAIEAAQAAGLSHARCVVLIEAGEESGSPDLLAHLEVVGERLGQPSLVICLDGGALDYEHLWVTTSLRGVVFGHLTVAVGREGVHSGEAGGVLPESFRVARALLERIEDAATGELRLPALHGAVPEERVDEARVTAAEQPPFASTLPFLPGVEPVVADPVAQLLNRSWRPSLSITGADGLPPTARAGNVLRPSTTLTLSLRLPPTVDADAAAAALTEALTAHPPHGAQVRFEVVNASSGWNAPAFAPWFRDALDRASTTTFGEQARTMGEGGSIPFMGMLGRRFPDAQFAITGVLGPGSNAHGPNEFLDLPTAERLTAAMALLLDDHARR